MGKKPRVGRSEKARGRKSDPRAVGAKVKTSSSKTVKKSAASSAGTASAKRQANNGSRSKAVTVTPVTPVAKVAPVADVPVIPTIAPIAPPAPVSRPPQKNELPASVLIGEIPKIPPPPPAPVRQEAPPPPEVTDTSPSAPLPPMLFEVAWEVCWQLGGIYTVLKTKAENMLDRW